MTDNQNWLYQGTEDAWLHYEYTEKPLEAPTTPNKVDNDQSSLEEVLEAQKRSVQGLSYDKRLAKLDDCLNSLIMVDLVRQSMGHKPFDSVVELQENLLLPLEISLWYDKVVGNFKFIKAIKNLKAWMSGYCHIPLDKSEMYLKDLANVMDKVPHTFNKEIKAHFLEHLDLILEWLETTIVQNVSTPLVTKPVKVLKDKALLHLRCLYGVFLYPTKSKLKTVKSLTM